MSLEIQQRDREGVLILDLNGRLTVGPEVSIFRDRMQKLIDTGSRQIVLNLQQVDYIDSTGLGVLMNCYCHAIKNSGALKLLNPDAPVKQVLSVTKVDRILQSFDDEAAALASFQAPTA